MLPGRDYLQQLRLIIEALGPPTAKDLSIIENPQAVEYINALPKKPPVPFEKLYPNANAQAIDLLRLMLKFDPRERINADKALKHEYLHALHNVNDEPIAEPFDFNFEETATTETELKGLIWKQLQKFHPELGAMPQTFGGGSEKMATQ